MLTHHDPLSLHIYTDHGRFYKVGKHQYPGVGNILSATDSAEQQEFWHQWRAVPNNATYSEQAKNRGKLFHLMVEQYFKNVIMTDFQDEEIAIAQPYWQSIQDILPRITTPLLIESAVWHEVGHYAGTVDMVCSFDGVPCILDWKTATKPKKTEYLERYPLQLTAYCGAINRMYSTRIKTGIIVVALPNSEAQVFQFSLGDYWQAWLSRLVSYWEKQDTPMAEQVLEMIRREYKATVAMDKTFQL